MFRLLQPGLPADIVYPKTLRELGLYINEADQLRKIEHDDRYRYRWNRNERVNEVYHDAVMYSLRQLVVERLSAYGVKKLYLTPNPRSLQPTGIPHLPILTTSPELLRRKKFVLVINNNATAELGIWSHHLATAKDGGLNAGSAVSLVRELLARCGVEGRNDSTLPGIIILNPGQLRYSHRLNEALSARSWEAQPRPSAYHYSADVLPDFNLIEENENERRHVDCVFDRVINNKSLVSASASLLFIGAAGGGRMLMEHLDANFALALTSSNDEANNYIPTDPAFSKFLTNRARNWLLSHHPINTPLANASPDMPVPCVSSGHEDLAEGILPLSYKAIMDWMEQVAAVGSEYKNGVFKIPESVLKEERDRLAAMEPPDWTNATFDEDREVVVQ